MQGRARNTTDRTCEEEKGEDCSQIGWMDEWNELIISEWDAYQFACKFVPYIQTYKHYLQQFGSPTLDKSSRVKKNERKKNEYKDPLLAVSFALLLLLMMNNRHDITWISINRTQMLEWEIPLCLPSHLYFPYPHSRRRCFLTPKNGLLEIEAINNTTNKGNYWLPPAWTARCHAVKHPWMPYTEGNGQSMSSIFPNGDTAAAFWW